MNTYRKTKDGKWVVFGPQSSVQKGSVQVQTKAGKIKFENVTFVTKPFPVNGVNHVYGFIAPKQFNKSNNSNEGWRGNGCSACRAKGDWCDRCYFDEFDC